MAVRNVHRTATYCTSIAMHELTRQDWSVRKSQARDENVTQLWGSELYLAFLVGQKWQAANS